RVPRDHSDSPLTRQNLVSQFAAKLDVVRQSPMPFYQAPHRPSFASTFRSFAQDPDQALRQALPEAVIERFAAEEGVTFGEQANAVYTPPVTLWAFLTQALSASKSCVAAVARVMVLCVSLSRPPCAAGTGPSCTARA